MAQEIDLDEYSRRVGQEIGVSSWRTIDQALIDKFADITDDHQFIHVDPVRAAQTPFGSTIAHGMLVLSLISTMSYEAVPTIRGATMNINYGFDRVRFVSPVPVNSRLRGRFVLAELSHRGAGQISTRYDVTIEREGSEKPAAAVEWLTMVVMAAAKS